MNAGVTNYGNAIVFKGDDDSNQDTDPYVLELTQLSLITKLIPALKFEFTNLDSLKERILSPDKFSGIVFSSPRCVQAVERCGSLSEWSNHKHFVVGNKTASLVRALGFNTLGEDCGNGAALAEFILKDFSSLKLPLLIPHGNLSLKTLINTLSNGGVTADCVEVYQTMPNPRLSDLIEEYYRNCSRVDFVVFMSPSAVNSCLPLLENFQDLSTIKFISLGPSTASYLEARGITPAGVADKPTPQHLADTMGKIITVEKKS